MYKAHLENLLDMYHPDNDTEKAFKEQMFTFLEQHQVVFGTENPVGHFTGSAWIVNKDRSKALLTHHLKLDRWLQLGGHTEVEETIVEASMREGYEESGLKKLELVSPMIFDIDCHLIPERKGLLEHWHLDVRFLLEADDQEQLIISDESNDVKWFGLETLKTMIEEDSILRMIRKTESLSKG